MSASIKNVPVSFDYAKRYRNGKIHKGTDFSDGHEGHTVLASLDGVVTHAGSGSSWGPAYGQCVIIRVVFKGKTKWILNGHMKTISVKKGQKVKLGQKLGTSGGRAGAWYSGNSTGAHLHTQVCHADNYLAYESPWPILNYVPVPPKPILPPRVGFRMAHWNLAGYDKIHGEASWNAREGSLVDEIANLNVKVFTGLELPGDEAAGFAKKLKAKANHTIAVRTDGRFISVAQGVRVGRTKKVTFKETGPAKDDKQAVFAEVWPMDGKPAFVVGVTQLDYRLGAKYDKARVAQGHEYVAAGVAFAKTCGVSDDRLILAADENSDSWVSHDCFGERFPDAMSLAYSKTNEEYRTLLPWSGKPSIGARIDKVHVGRNRKIRAASVRLAAGHRSDHLPTVVLIGLNSK